jgi:ABC-type transport system involved in multi-copper enzyme maturation permease subunit
MADRSESSPATGQQHHPHHQATFASGLLHYRPWQGTLAAPDGYGPVWFLVVQAGLLGMVHFISAPVLQLILVALFVLMWGLVTRCRAWPITRVSLGMIFRRRLFWALYALALMVFLGFFFGQYLMSWASSQIGETEVRVGGLGRANPAFLVKFFRGALKLDGSAEMFRNFMSAEANTVMIVLVLAGSVLIGNDLRFGSMPFFLSKPISRWDYLLGKGLAVAVFINLFTTLPAVVLFVQYGLLETWDYFLDFSHLLVGIVCYGMVLTACCTLLLLAMATWLRRTVPLIMTWTALFSFCQILSGALVNGLHQDRRWRLIDVWNSAGVVGNHLLGIDPARINPQPQPAVHEAALVLCGVCLACLIFLILRIRAVEIVK